MTFTKIAREEAAFYWEKSFEHPFIQRLAAGDLESEIFVTIYFRTVITLNILVSFTVRSRNRRMIKKPAAIERECRKSKLGEMAIRIKNSFRIGD